jgi:PAS domain S-box-containing protein
MSGFNRINLWLVGFALALNPAWLGAQTEPATVRLGVLAYRGADEARRAWAPTADYLTARVPGHRFEIVPLEFAQVLSAARRGEVDFIATSPSSYVEIESATGASRIATLISLRQGTPLTKFGAVIFTRADRTDIQDLSDLEAKRFIATDPNSFGGWLMARRELQEARINPTRDLKSLEFAGTQDAVVHAVREGKADAGTVRTDQLEQMAGERKIVLDQFRVLNLKPADEYFPFPRSTRLYPEWPMAKLSHTSDVLARDVALALLEMPGDSEAARAAQCAGWTIPADYSEVHELMRELRLGPYEQYGSVSLWEAIRQHVATTAGTVAALLVLAGTTLYFIQLNRKLYRTQAALAQSEQRNRAVVEQAADGITLVDAQTLRIVEVNQAFARLVGYTRDELVGRPIAELIADTPEGVSARAQQTLGSGAPVGVPRQYRRKDGSLVDVEKSAAVIEHDGRRVLCTVVHDITERKQAEAALAAERNLLRTVIDNLPDRVYVKDCQGRYVLDNIAHQKQIGVSDASAVIGKTGYDLFPQEVAARFEQDDQAIQRAGQPMVDREEQTTDKRGNRRWLLTTKVPFTDGNGTIIGIVGLSRDITELKSAQTQLVQAEKLAGLGQMVAGVAHEINNPLSFVANNVAVLQRDLAPLRELIDMYRRSDPILAQHSPEAHKTIRELIERIDLNYTLNNLNDLMQRSREGLRRIQQIVKDLRDFARLDEGDLHDADINAGIQSTANIILGRAKKKQVTIDLRLGPLPVVSCYPAKINQVVMNLLSNAIDASKPGEKVTIATRASDGEVQIEVIDTGCGIPAHARERIFDPFFTTKPQGEGTGLGLSISYGIVKDHGGKIEVDSTEGAGTRFKVRLPLSRSR